MKIRIIYLLLAALSSFTLLAQGAPPGTPIDGGLSILLAAGGVYGLKKIRENRRK